MAEIWGNTPAQVRYDIRTDLGNTPEVDGDGKLYMGRGPLMATGKDMYETLSKEFGVDLVSRPELVSMEPWSMMSAGYIWAKVKKLNKIADQDNLNLITKRINGGFNGLTDRIAWTGKVKAAFKI